MRQYFILACAAFLTLAAQAQKKKEWSIAFMNTQTAMPFAKFSSLFSKDLHPGIEGGFAITLKEKKKHAWVQEFKAGYFFHRFVQHGIPVYTSTAYRYKFSGSFGADALLGIGYLHSIPAIAKLKLNADGEYENNKGAGRMQAMANVGFRAGYLFNRKKARPIRLYLQYMQQLQFPFVKSYVPLLPYNTLLIGTSWTLKTRS